jgi:hypothetical protein
MTAAEKHLRRLKSFADLNAAIVSLEAEINSQKAKAGKSAALRKERTPPAPGKTKAQRKTTKAKSDREVYAEVSERDAGLCTVQLSAAVLGECGGPLQIDHQWGRGKEPTLVENCRKLCKNHHDRKTDGIPSRLMWLNDYREHAVGHDYHGEAAKAEGQIALERAQHPAATAIRVVVR